MTTNWKREDNTWPKQQHDSAGARIDGATVDAITARRLNQQEHRGEVVIDFKTGDVSDQDETIAVGHDPLFDNAADFEEWATPDLINFLNESTHIDDQDDIKDEQDFARGQR